MGSLVQSQNGVRVICLPPPQHPLPQYTPTRAAAPFYSTLTSCVFDASAATSRNKQECALTQRTIA